MGFPHDGDGVDGERRERGWIRRAFFSNLVQRVRVEYLAVDQKKKKRKLRSKMGIVHPGF